MQTVILVFMAFAALLCLFSVLVVLRDIIKEIYANRKTKEDKAIVQPTQAIQPVVQVQPVAQVEVAEQPAPAEEIESVDEVATQTDVVSDDSISFQASGHQKTLDEKYADLLPEQKDWYDSIVAYALSKEGAKSVKNNRYQEIKLGRTRLVRMLIKLDIVTCLLIMQNSHFKNYLNENKISLKPAATIVRVMSEGEVKLVKDSIDIIVAGLAEEKEYKKQLAKQRRKANRQAQKGE